MVKNKKIILIILIIIIIICLLFIVIINSNKTKTLECKNTISNKSYDEKINFSIKYSKKIKTFSKDYVFNFKEGYMDNLVDKYDNMNKYLNYIKKNNGIITDIKQDGYTLNYKIDIEIDKVNKKDYKILELDEVTKLDSMKEIKKYYENLGYTCK